MTKNELVHAIAADTGIAKVFVEKVLAAQGQVIRASLKTGDEVMIPEIGKLHIKRNEARKGRNPATGAAVDIPAKNVVKLKVTSALADAVA